LDIVLNGGFTVSMDSIKRGFEFLKQSWKMAFADQDLLKPSIYALFAGFLLTLASLVPLALIGIFLGDFGFGRVLLFALMGLLLFSQFIVTYVFSAMTAYLIYGYLAEGDGRLDKAWAVVRRDAWDLTSLAAASAAIRVLQEMMSGRKNNLFRETIANLVGVLWTEATYLVLPAMVIEDLNLRDGLKRAGQIMRDNLVLVGISTVGVRAVTGLIGFLLGGFGIFLGVVVGVGLATIFSGSTWSIVAGVVLGILFATPFLMSAAVVNTYTATAYHTCLYLWARDVERARQAGLDVPVTAPRPLAAVLE
jgi:hypothetical protein